MSSFSVPFICHKLAANYVVHFAVIIVVVDVDDDDDDDDDDDI